MTSAVGTRAWAVSGGSLRKKDRIRLVAQALLVRISLLPQRLRSQLGFGDSAANRIDLSAIRFPDSIASRRASELAESLSTPWLFNHCLRTYVWGAMLAQSEQIKFDEELFFVASALHDLGLTENHKCKESGCACFAVEGARAAEQFVAEIGWEKERRDRLAEAILLHLNVRVGIQYGPEAHLLHEGAALDVIGARIREIHPTSIESVLKQYPRLTFKQEMSAAMKEQARERPHSRAAFLVGLGFIGMIRSARLEDPLAPNQSLHTHAQQAARR
jgi:hypothetical protein